MSPKVKDNKIGFDIDRIAFDIKELASDLDEVLKDNSLGIQLDEEELLDSQRFYTLFKFLNRTIHKNKIPAAQRNNEVRALSSIIEDSIKRKRKIYSDKEFNRVLRVFRMTNALLVEQNDLDVAVAVEERNPDIQYLSTGRVAKMLGVSNQTVRNMIENGKIKAEKVGSHYRIPANKAFVQNMKNFMDYEERMTSQQEYTEEEINEMLKEE